MKWSSPNARAFRTFVAIAGSLVLAVYWTLVSVREPLASAVGGDPSPYGYTRSLALFLVPLAALGWWFWRHPELSYPRRAFWRSALLLAALGIALDLLFANTFFVFPNHNATLGECVDSGGQPLPWSAASLLCIPARGGVVPVEEFVFYVSGFMVVLMAYIWADEYWLARYNVPDYTEASRGVERIVRFHPAALALGAGLVALSFILRAVLGSEIDGGFPGYACYLIAAAVVPSAGLFRTARDFINWRAFNFTFFSILLVSLIWEVTLALPYGWWGYDPRWMIGGFITAWFGLPIEAVFVWLAVTFATVIVYETIKIWLASGRSARRAFFG